MKKNMPQRREVLALGAALAGSVLVRPASAQADDLAAAIAAFTGGATVRPGRVTMEIAKLVDNGNVVPLSVTVDSPMTANDHVKAIHVFTEKNPQPNVISAKLGPRAGKAEIQTRVRLADTETVVAICEMSDGSFWSNTVDVIITLGACLEDPV